MFHLKLKLDLKFFCSFDKPMLALSVLPDSVRLDRFKRKPLVFLIMALEMAL